MVGSAVHGADAVETSGDRAHIGGEDTIHGGTVDTLEEIEFCSVQECCVGERRDLLHCHMGMTDELSPSVDLSRGHIVGFLRLGEGSCLHLADVHLHREIGARGDLSKVLWEGDLDCWSVVG